jgi:RNA polymerase sigma-70 factor (family 1)
MEEQNLHDWFRCLSGADPQLALWRVHALFFHSLFRLIYSIVQSKEVTEELTNDVFIQLWQSRHKMKDVENPEVYLYVCAKNRAFAYLKSQKIAITSLDRLSDFDFQLERTPEDILHSSEMLRYINAAIQQLPPKCKLIFMLVKESNLKYRQVAEILGLSQKTVEAQMSIALKKLSQAIPFSFDQ